jgi:hypothetical protein
MARVLEAILESVKTPPPSSAEASGSKTEDVPKMIIEREIGSNLFLNDFGG